MEFTNAFTVGAPIQTVWSVMLDPEQVTPCVPGAQITEVMDDRHYRGTVKVKLGPVQVSYRGEMELDPDEPTRTIVMRAKGTEARGSGGASGTITTRLREESGTTHVEIASQVDVTGRAAQFGRGIMQDVADHLIQQFAACLEAKLGEAGAAASASTSTEPASTPETPQAGPAAPPEPPPIGLADEAPPAPARSPIQPAAQAPAPTKATAPAPASELRLADLLLDVSRRRLASWLRTLASRIEPR